MKILVGSKWEEIRWKLRPCRATLIYFNPLSAGIFPVFTTRFLESRVLHNGAWVATLLGTLLGTQDYNKKVKFPCTVCCWPMALKGLRETQFFAGEAKWKMFVVKMIKALHLKFRVCLLFANFLLFHFSLNT